jgi:hypothetical protein
MKYWEIIADNLTKAGWSLGWVSALDSKRANDLDSLTRMATEGGLRFGTGINCSQRN